MADPALALWYNFAADKNVIDRINGLTLDVARAGATGTRVNSAGFIEIVAANAPRFGHDPVTLASLGLLVEEAREQIAVDTGDVSDNAVWVPTNMTKGSNAVTDPMGNMNTNVRLTAAAGNATLLQTVTSAQDNYVYGQYIRRITGTGDIDLTLDDGGTWATQELTPNWSRFVVTDAEETNPVFGVRIVTSGDAIEFWGPDVNKDAAFLTSHIPNDADSGTVTRNVDVVSTTDMGWYNSSAATIYAKASQPYSTSAFSFIFEVSDNSTSDRGILRVNDSNDANYNHISELSVVANLTSTANEYAGAATVQSVAAYAVDDVELYANGSRIGTGDQSAALPVGIIKSNIGTDFNGLTSFNGHIAEIRYYNVHKGQTEGLQYLEDLSNGRISEADLLFSRDLARPLARNLARLFN